MDAISLTGSGVALAVVTVVMAATAAAETALERASEARIRALAARGEARAQRIAGKVSEPRAFLGPLTATRVLASSATVAIAGWIGASTFGPAGAVLIGMAGGLWAAVVQMTVGLLAARQPELAALQLSGVVRVTGSIAGGPAWVLSIPARILARSLRAVAGDGYNDLLALVEREEATGRVAEYETRMIRGVIALEEKTAREIMIPRIDMAVADINDSVIDVARMVTERGYSRIPVYRENIDDIAGIVYAKDLLRITANGGRPRKLADILRPASFIPESKRLDDLLTEMQVSRVHLAIVVDEYGGTAGLVTIEDLLEEIVGEIEDEYDVAGPRTEVISDHAAIVDGGASTDVLDELFQTEVESDDYDTVGGFVMHHLGRLPKPGDTVKAEGLVFEVLNVRGRRVGRVRVERPADDAEARSEEEALTRTA
ncbi:MAG: hemolysin family protein [Dehalococcoidia bacterium]